MTDPNFKKISDMTALSAAAADDIIPIIDVSEALDANKNKKITTANLRKDITVAELKSDFALPAAKMAGLSTDPDADKMVFWDDGAGSLAYLEPGAGLTITDTTVDLDHLGIEDLADPNADRIGFWDDSAGKMDWLIPGAGLTIDDKTINAGVGTNELAAGSVTNPIIRDSAALSVIGRASDSAGDVDDIAAASDGQVLRRSGTTLGFGKVALAGMDANSVDSDQYVDGSIDAVHIAPMTSAQLATIVSDETGSGKLVFDTSPTLVTPALGTPASGVLTNCTGLPTSGIVDYPQFVYYYNLIVSSMPTGIGNYTFDAPAGAKTVLVLISAAWNTSDSNRRILGRTSAGGGDVTASLRASAANVYIDGMGIIPVVNGVCNYSVVSGEVIGGSIAILGYWR